MPIKKIIFATILLFISLTAVSAADDNQTLNNGTFDDLSCEISNASTTLKLERDYEFNSSCDKPHEDGISIDRDLEIDGQGHTINAGYNARIFKQTSGNLILKNIKFMMGNSDEDGGALQLNGTCKVYNCSFKDNRAGSVGGAIYSKSTIEIRNCEFENNVAYSGGSIRGENVNVINSTFQKSRGVDGAAISGSNVNIEHCNFTENLALGGGILHAREKLTSKGCVFTKNDLAYNSKEILLAENATFEYTVDLKLVNATSVTYGERVIIQVEVELDGEKMNAGEVYFIINNEIFKGSVINGTAIINADNINAGAHIADIVYNGSSNYTKTVLQVKFNVFPKHAAITAYSKSYIINYGGIYSVKVNSSDGEKVRFELDGKLIGTGIVKDGVASFELTSKILKSAKSGRKNIIVKLDSTNYNATDKTAKITVIKEKSKITAKKKSFKRSKKVKKYPIIIKNSKGKGIPNVKVSLKIKGKTYKSKSNPKGKAIFKIKKLTKKGKYIAKVNFKGDACYKGTVKKVKIIIK